MTPTAAQVLASAKALSAAERAEIAEELVLSMADADDAVRHTALKAAIEAAVRGIDSGEGIRVPANRTREYIRELGREATRTVDAEKA